MLRETPGRATAESEYLSLLLHASEKLGESAEYRETLKNVARAAVGTVADICIIDIGEAGDTNAVGAAHRDPAFNSELEMAGEHLESEPGRPSHPVCQVLKSREIFYEPHIDDAWIEANATGAEHASFMRRMKYTSMIVVPLISHVYGLTGALTLVTTADGRAPFESVAVEFAQTLARMCAAAIGKARLYSEAQTTALTFQRAALPRILPEAPNLHFYSYYQPARRSMLIGGDWYDAFPLPDGRIGICVGDVSGHGLEASVMMASLRNALRTALVMEPDIGRAIDAVDYLLRTEYTDRHFCTAVLAILDTEAMTLRLASAGHPGPKIWDPVSGTVTDPFTQRDLPIGFRDMASPTNPRTVRLGGGIVVFYTDGLVECRHNIEEGEAQLEAAMARKEIRDAADPALAIRDAVVGDTEPADDLAVFVARFDNEKSPANARLFENGGR